MASKAEKEEKAERFIEEWKEIRCLWDVISTEYRDRNEKRKGYEKLASLCEMSGHTVPGPGLRLKKYTMSKTCFFWFP